MTDLPTLHKRALMVAVAVVIAAVVAYFMCIVPLQREVNELKDSIDGKRRELRSAGFPLNPARLAVIDSELAGEKARHYKSFASIYDQCMSGLKSRIDVYDSTEVFRRSIGQLDYQEEFLSIKTELEEAGIYLDEGVLGISETSSAMWSYQLLTHLWIVKDLTLLAKKHNLKLQDESIIKKSEDEKFDAWRRAHPPVNASVLPVQAYITSAGQAPFVEEYPVRLTVQGKVKDYCEFLTALTQAGTFLPLERSAIRKVGLENPRNDWIEGELVCSAFLMIRDKDELATPVVNTQQKKRRWRRGS